MIAVFAVTFLYALFVWLVFFRFRWLRLTPVWGVLTLFVGLHLVLVPLVGMRFVAPLSEDVRLVRHTVQLVPRLPEPTLVETVLVHEGQAARKGDPLIVFDDSLFQSQVTEAKAALEAAKQNVLVLKADVTVAEETLARTKAELAYKEIEAKRYAGLAAQRAAPQAEAQKYAAEVTAGEAAVAEAEAEIRRAEAAYGAQVGGVNTAVIQAQEQLAQAEYYLDQTVIRAPGDGTIVNLQVYPGMVSGIIRAGAIASFILDDDPYLLAMFRQENLKFVRPGQDALVALNLYPGQHFRAKVRDIWWAGGRGQLLPSGDLPVFPDQPAFPEARFPVELVLEPADLRLPIGAEGAALILTDPSSPFTWVGQIALRAYTWGRWLYPMPF